MVFIEYDLYLEKLIRIIEVLMLLLDKNVSLTVVPSRRNSIIVKFNMDCTEIEIETELLSEESPVIRRKNEEAKQYLKELIAGYNLVNRKTELLEKLLKL